MKKLSNDALRLPVSLLERVKQIAAADGTTVNQLINVAVAENEKKLRRKNLSADGVKRTGHAA